MYKLYPINKLTGEPSRMVIRLTDHTHIPFNLDNTDYQEYLKWVAEGNEPEPADEPESP